MARKNSGKDKLVRRQSIRLTTPDASGHSGQSNSQSDSETIRKRLWSIENNFHLLDQQLLQLETKLDIEPLLQEESSPKKPR